jgi:4'-phosphopantetheinyl transferase
MPRRNLRPSTRAQLVRLAGQLIVPIAGKAGSLEETAKGPRGGGAWSDLSFSVAYAGHRALVGVARHWRLGVDLLEVLPIPEWQAVAALYLAPETLSRLQRLPARELPAAFAIAWTAREADLKCLAIGLTERPVAATVGLDLLRLCPTVDADCRAAVALHRQEVR